MNKKALYKITPVITGFLSLGEHGLTFEENPDNEIRLNQLKELLSSFEGVEALDREPGYQVRLTKSEVKLILSKKFVHSCEEIC